MNIAWALTTTAALLWVTVAPAAGEDSTQAPPWAVVLAVVATGGAVGAWTA